MCPECGKSTTRDELANPISPTALADARAVLRGFRAAFVIASVLMIAASFSPVPTLLGLVSVCYLVTILLLIAGPLTTRMDLRAASRPMARPAVRKFFFHNLLLNFALVVAHIVVWIVLA